MSELHIDILLLLRAVGQYGLDVSTLRDDLRQRRHQTLSEPQLLAALRDLADQSFVDQFTSALRKQRWKILGLGESALREAKL